MIKHIDRIAQEHGCEILPTAIGKPALCVQPRYQRGNPHDGKRLRECFAALEAAGIDTTGWVS